MATRPNQAILKTRASFFPCPTTIGGKKPKQATKPLQHYPLHPHP